MVSAATDIVLRGRDESLGMHAAGLRAADGTIPTEPRSSRVASGASSPEGALSAARARRLLKERVETENPE